MDIFFNGLTMIGGLSLFLFGMNVMGQALERKAGGKLRTVLSKMTTGKLKGFFTGCLITAIIQSSSATTIMVVGFVNSSLMTLKQAINVIMGANVGTTITGWILSLEDVDGDSFVFQMFKPSSFTPIVALIGIVLYIFIKGRQKDTGLILLGFATLMFGMETMTGSVSSLADVPQFQQLFVTFENPILGLGAGMILTALIQSSTAAVGILQALAVSGSVSVGAAIPIIMGASIGTCITAMISSIGAKIEARRAAMVHLIFNLLGSVIWLTVFLIVNSVFSPQVFGETSTMVGIAIINTAFNLLSTLAIFPFTSIVEKIATTVIRDTYSSEERVVLDQRLFVTPHIALQRSREVTLKMMEQVFEALVKATGLIENYWREKADGIRHIEEKCDKYEDIIGTYLVRLNARNVTQKESEEITQLLKASGDIERISDYAVNIVIDVERLQEKGISLPKEAVEELGKVRSIIVETLKLTYQAFSETDVNLALKVEPLRQKIQGINETMRDKYILWAKEGKATVESGLIWSNILNSLERVPAHCDNITAVIIGDSRK